MYTKWVVLAVALGAGVVSVVRAEPPIEPGAAATATAGIGQRFRYSIGSVGTALVGGTVRRSVLNTERSLSDMAVALKRAGGSDGTRARSDVRKIRHADSLAVQHLYYARPVKAVKKAMEAKNLLNAVRENLNEQI